MESIIAQEDSKLASIIKAKYNLLSYSSLQKLFRNKDIKVNGVRTNKDILVSAGDRIEIYASEQVLHGKQIEIVFEDDNILVANKPAGMEVCDGEGDTLEKLLCQKQKVYAVHRIDRNTTGLVVFAKNVAAKTELEKMFKEHRIEKYYLAVVYGVPKQKEQKLVAYLKKDANKAVVEISDTQKPGYDKIITSYKVVESKNDTSLLDVVIETGKTHQIRAHLAHVGFPIVGDDKYGSKKQNDAYKKHKQMLCAHKIVFIEPKYVLSHLKCKAFELDTKDFYKI